MASKSPQKLDQRHSVVDLMKLLGLTAAGCAPTAGPAPLLLLLPQARRLLAGLRRIARERRLDLLEGEQQLVLGKLLRLPPELPALQLQQQVLQPLVLGRQGVALGGDAPKLGAERVDLRQRPEQKSAQRRGILRQCRRVVSPGAHRAMDSTQARSAWESPASPARGASRSRRTAR